MSQKNGEGKRSARTRMQEERAAEEAKAKRLRKLGISGAVLAVLVVAVVVGILVMNSKSTSYNASQAPAGTIGANNLVVPVGATNAPSTLTIYEDPRCPACGDFEKSFHTTVNQLLGAGKVQIHYHVVSFIDRHDQGSGSKNAANALGCAQNAGLFHPYHDVLYANQPDETVDVWSDRSVLITLAKQVKGLDTPTFESCVNNNGFGAWVTAVETDFDKSGYNSTPTILLNGTVAYPSYKGTSLTPQSLVTLVDTANKGKPLGTLSAADASALATPRPGAS
ncbi:thioredoxin domain-containing protein [Streptacidiphilus sp. P02-A3a]|uniref:DsbA family protein n=1 Tax=Streptacidiphilus sp. P02-A3a TaxID=2704468 RepID=UPI0015F97C26|nr:thioredoxin domain-containing protein [Streptacidiphilus sp. P02-A3a]QMU73713.1 thioredoxin domain-containing protein [Streptacidiphilus sp. P02-A3a]